MEEKTRLDGLGKYVTARCTAVVIIAIDEHFRLIPRISSK
jgi:hypothetical protein